VRRLEKIAELHYEEPTREWSTPDGRWELVVVHEEETRHEHDRKHLA
jgi:hypothetical protein